MRKFIYHFILLLVILAFLVWSAFGPYERFTWFLEVAPVLVLLPILAFTYKRYPLTNLLYTLLTIHCLILIIGGHYTYALTPIGDWMKELFGFTRNNYDKIGHFAQGFIPVILVREILLKSSPLQKGGWLSFISASICLAMCCC